MSFFSCFELNSKVIRIRIKNYIFPHKALKNQNTHTQIMITLHWIHFCNSLHFFCFISFSFDIVVINLLDAHIYSPILQYSHLFLSALSNVAYYLYRFIFFFHCPFFSFICKICPLLNQFHTSCVRVDISFGSHFFSHIHIFWYCVCILFRLVKRKYKKNTTYFLRSWLQINFKVCRADLFSMFIFAVLFLSMLLRLFGICVYFHNFFSSYLYLASLESFSKNG